MATPQGYHRDTSSDQPAGGRFRSHDSSAAAHNVQKQLAVRVRVVWGEEIVIGAVREREDKSAADFLIGDIASRDLGTAGDRRSRRRIQRLPHKVVGR